MKTNKHIDQEVEKTLTSLDELTEVKVKPYFYTRLTARMEHQDARIPVSWRWSLAAIALIVLLNVVSLLNYSSADTTSSDPLDELTAEYTISSLDIYQASLEE